MLAQPRIRVLVVDDSALVRKLLTAVLDADPEIQVVGSATDPFDAREKIKALSPDVITLDVEMPKMDGLTFLRNLMRLRPMPVVMVSSLTARGADVTMAALQSGAVDFVCKPGIDVADGLGAMADELCAKVKFAARTKVRPLIAASERAGGSIAKSTQAPEVRTTDTVIAIGASTGGTEAVARILAELPPDCPAVLIGQHIPEVFSARFAERLDREGALRVSEAKDGDPVLIGHAYVAPGNRHLRLVRSGARYYCKVSDEPAVNHHRPSIDVLFRSVASQAGSRAVGVILTGMGQDGAQGLLEMKQAGAATLAQDRESCVVFSMPHEAIKRGAADETLGLDSIAQRLLFHARRVP